MRNCRNAVDWFDVVVLGGGVAGCVVAARLSEDPGRRVCLVEAGPDFGGDLEAWPATIRNARILPRDHVWESGVEPFRIRGKVLGGSSSINGCWHTWGSPTDYARWAARGGLSWSEESLERHRARAAAEMRLRAPAEHELSVWSDAAVTAAGRVGFPWVTTAAPSTGVGVGAPLLNVLHGMRRNAALAYLEAARNRPNLRIFSAATVDRLALSRERVTGAELIADRRRTVVAGGEYVIACGAFGSPGVLMRSGIGPARHLAEVGVTAKVDLPGVGENLADHAGVFVPLVCSDELNALLAEKDAAGDLYVSRILIRAAGPFCAPESWDLHVLPTAGPPLFGSMPPGTYEAGISAFVMNPASRGTVRLQSSDPEAALSIRPEFLSDPDGRDIATVRVGVAIAEELAATEPLASLATPKDAGSVRELADNDLRARVGSYWHPVGTCAVGPESDPLAVVDVEARVRGIDNLRVVDASILPDLPAANTQLSVLAVAEMVAASMAG